MFGTTFIKAADYNSNAFIKKEVKIVNNELPLTVESAVMEAVKSNQPRFYAEWLAVILITLLLNYLVFIITQPTEDRSFAKFEKKIIKPFFHFITPYLIVIITAGIIAQYRDIQRKEEAVKEAFDFNTITA